MSKKPKIKIGGIYRVLIDRPGPDRDEDLVIMLGHLSPGELFDPKDNGVKVFNLNSFTISKFHYRVGDEDTHVQFSELLELVKCND
jgi:hypothetical protein